MELYISTAKPLWKNNPVWHLQLHFVFAITWKSLDAGKAVRKL